jgi:4-hydroxybenzoate polyprenyltransferase
MLMRDDALVESSKITVLLPSSKVGVSRESRRETSSFETRGFEAGAEAAPAGVSWRLWDALRPVHVLHIYGAVGIATFGWSLGRWAGFASGKLMPLWLAGALVVYNLDRLHLDPSDHRNTPVRARWHGILRSWSWLLAAAGAAVLVLWPLWIGNGALLLLTCLALPLSLSYSFPLMGSRLKDVPVLKTLFAPLVVLTAVLAPPILLQGLAVGAPLLLAAGWSWSLLMFNMLLCDLRDIDGDRAAGTKSLPVLLGGRGTLGLLWLLIAAGAACALMHGWPILAWATVALLSPLALAAQRRRNEAFYEWLAEGTLFLPALVELGKHLVHRLAA